MGSLFSTPKPTVTAPPASPPAAQPAPDKAADDATAEDAARIIRNDALERRRYGRAGLIATGYRGLLRDRIAAAGGGKNLLGE